MSAHTPTPWSLDETNADDIQRPTRYAGPVVVYADEDCETHPIAYCSCNHTCRDDETQRANAEFIVRAVNSHDDLVAALSGLFELCMNTNNGAFSNGVTDSTGTIDEGECRASDYLDRAKSALAKAEGRS